MEIMISKVSAWCCLKNIDRQPCV